nr:transposase domain-containing protein [Variovorax sp. KBS0712]
MGGANASANLYSLIEIAKANNIEPYRYLVALFKKLRWPRRWTTTRLCCPGTSCSASCRTRLADRHQRRARGYG